MIKKPNVSSAGGETQLDYELLTAVTGVIHQCAADVMRSSLKSIQSGNKNILTSGLVSFFGGSGSPTRPAPASYAPRLRAAPNVVRLHNRSCNNLTRDKISL